MFAIALSTAPALAQPNATPAERMATRAGEVIGAASACGVSEDRLVAVGRTVIEIIREVARSPAELRKAQAAHERAVTLAASRSEQGDCATHVAAFERAEAN